MEVMKATNTPNIKSRPYQKELRAMVRVSLGGRALI
jgi:hypothetical protein